MPRRYEETGLVRAHAKWVRTSARKVRIVLEHVRGLPVAEARNQLRFATRHAAQDISKVLESAIANAVNNHGLDEGSLIIHEAFADEGVTMKRWQPRARGRAMRIRKRTAHITILLRAEGVALPTAAAKATKAAPAAKSAPEKAAPAEAAPAKAAPAKAAAPKPKPKPKAAKAVVEAVEAVEVVEPVVEPVVAAEPAAEAAPKPKRTRKPKAAAAEPAAEPEAGSIPEGEEA